MEKRAWAEDVPAAVAAEAYSPPENWSDLLVVDGPMRTYFAERLSTGTGAKERLREIVDLILEPRGLGFAYDAEATFDARETFRRRRGNCVSFSFLVVAVAREFGLRASFQSIESAIRWDRFGDIVASVRHLNIRVETFDAIYVVDLQPDFIVSPKLESIRVVHDKRACAQFYSNTGFFRFVHGEAQEALRYLTIATAIDPGYAGAWANRAAVLTEMGDPGAARKSYEQALRADRHCVVAQVGMVDVLHRLGSAEDLELAAKFERKVQAIHERSPYYLQYKATEAGDQGDWATAEKYLRRAIALKDNEPEFYVQRVTALQHLGRVDEARRLEAKLKRLRAHLATVSDRILP